MIAPTDYMKPAPFRLIKVATNVAYVQARNCWGCLHIGSTAFYLWTPYDDNRHGSWRLEVLTPMHKWRFSAHKGKPCTQAF